MNEATNVNEAEQRRAVRKRFRVQYRALYDELLEILFQLDPMAAWQNRFCIHPPVTCVLKADDD